jgi:nucleoside-diphosphate-sugar epimerase
MSETILVTGGAGFIGSQVARMLIQRGDRVIVFDTQQPGSEAAWWLKSVRERITFVQGSIDSWADVIAVTEQHRPDAIVHTAAIGNPNILHKRPQLALRVNVEGSLNVLEAARIFGVRRVVVYSSIGALPSVQYEPIDTRHPVILPSEGPGTGFYGASKVAVEAFCFGYQQAFGLDFIVLRPSAVYGFGMQYPIYIKPMVEDALAGRPTRFGSGREFPRDYTHVQDVAQLTLRALDVPADQVRDRIFYAATGEPLHTAGEVAQIVQSLIPTADIAIASGLSAADQIEIRYRGRLSIQNARAQLGYTPRFTKLADGIAHYIEHYHQYQAEQ